jgi:DHA1 family bicyclomycin/chloramphenicol resistance-like MFS transporter
MQQANAIGTYGGDATSISSAAGPLHPAAFTLLLAALSMLGQFAIATYLPAFADMARSLGASAAQMQQTITAYMLPFGLMVLWHGAVSDAVGRRRMVLVGLALFSAGSLLCATAHDLNMLYAGRVIQGCSAGIGVIVGRAMVRDVFHGAAAQRQMALVAMVFSLAPVIAPVCGGWLLYHAGWRSIFVFLSALTALMMLAAWRWLPETLPADKRHSLHPLALARAYAAVFALPRFVYLALANAAVNMAIYVYIFAAPEFVTKHLGLNAQSFAWLFGPIVCGLLVGSLLGHRAAVQREGTPASPWRTIANGHIVMLAANVLNLAVSWLQLPGIPWSLLALLIFAAGLMLTQPGLQLLALDCVPARRGLASSCYVAAQQFGNAVSAAVLIPPLMGSTLGLAAGMAALQLFGAAMLALAHRSPQTRAESS